MTKPTRVKPNPCEGCGSRDVTSVFLADEGEVASSCYDCGIQGPIVKIEYPRTLDEAIETASILWNKDSKKEDD